jgi:VanZ family protein
MPKFDKNLVYRKLPPLLYALAILSLSLLKNPPAPDLGISWEDKIYHCMEYFVFGLLVARAFPGFSVQPRRRSKIAMLILFGILYSAIDETIQYFVPGRDSSVWDSLADTIGFTLSVFVVLWWRTKAKYDVEADLRENP